MPVHAIMHACPRNYVCLSTQLCMPVHAIMHACPRNYVCLSMQLCMPVHVIMHACPRKWTDELRVGKAKFIATPVR
jgi:hypothetical protein